MSDKKNSVLSNTASILFIRLLSPATTFLLLIYLSRKLGAEELGKYSLLIVLFQLAQCLPLLGLQPYVVREIAKNRSLVPKFVSNLLPLGFLVSLGISGLLYAGVCVLHYPSDVCDSSALLTVAIVSSSVTLLCEAILVGFERMTFIALVASSENLLKILLSFWVVYRGYGLFSLIAVLSGTRILGALFYLSIVRKQAEISSFEMDFPFCGTLLKKSPVFLGNTLLGMLFGRLDFLFLSKLGTFEQLGFYSAAYRILEMCTLLSSTIIFAIFPKMARLSHNSREELSKLLQLTVRFLFMAFVLIFSGFFAFAEDGILLLYKHGFEPSIPILKILMIAALFGCLEPLFESVLLVYDKQNQNLKILGLCLAFYAFLLIFLIPPYGMHGAALATAIAVGGKTALRYFFMQKSFPLLVWPLVWKTILAGLFLAAFPHFFHAGVWPLRAVLAGALYILILLVFRSFSFSEVRQLFVLKKNSVLP